MTSYLDGILERSSEKEEGCGVQEPLLAEKDERVLESSLSPPEFRKKDRECNRAQNKFTQEKNDLAFPVVMSN